MAPRHVIAAIVFGVAIGLLMHYVLGGNPLIHMAIAVIGTLAGAWVGTRKKARRQVIVALLGEWRERWTSKHWSYFLSSA